MADTSDLGRAVQDVALKAQLLVREEIELAKAEMSAKINKLIKGIIVGAIAGIFALFGLIYLLHGLAWAIWSLFFDSMGTIWAGFVILALILMVLAAVAGLVAARLVKRGTPPTPQMAIEEAQRVRETISASRSDAGRTA